MHNILDQCSDGTISALTLTQQLNFEQNIATASKILSIIGRNKKDCHGKKRR